LKEPLSIAERLFYLVELFNVSCLKFQVAVVASSGSFPGCSAALLPHEPETRNLKQET
jgi:hypothetical protein